MALEMWTQHPGVVAFDLERRLFEVPCVRVARDVNCLECARVHLALRIAALFDRWADVPTRYDGLYPDPRIIHKGNWLDW